HDSAHDRSGKRRVVGVCICNNVNALGRAHAQTAPLRGGVDAPSAAKAQTGWSEWRNVSAELTTPASQLLISCRATPPLRGGECGSAQPRVTVITNHGISVDRTSAR